MLAFSPQRAPFNISPGYLPMRTIPFYPPQRAPFNISVGKVNTDHHCVTLKVKSTLDSCDDEDGGGEGGEGGEAAAAAAGTNGG